LRSGGRMAEALDVLDPVRPGESESAIALQARSTLAFELGDFESAERCSRAALEREPGFVLAQVCLGHALVNRGRFTEARKVLLRARGLVESSGARSPRLERTLERCEAFLRQEGTPGRALPPMAYADYLRFRESLARLPGLETNSSGVSFVFSCRNHLTGVLRLARTRRIPARPHRGHHPHRGPAPAQAPQTQPQLPAAALPALWP